jgi:propanediol dehydratase small subunit
MSEERLSIADYPLAEKRPEIVRGKRGKGLDEITLEALLEDRVTLEDLRITDAALRQQAEIASAAGRDTLAANFERGAELVDVPQDTIMRIYELLRPGRAQSQEELLAAARELRDQYGTEGIAAFVEEAAAVYERRGLFKKRF